MEDYETSDSEDDVITVVNASADEAEETTATPSTPCKNLFKSLQVKDELCQSIVFRNQATKPMKYQDVIVRFTPDEKYSTNTQLQSDSSSTLSSAWDIEIQEVNRTTEPIKAPIAQFKRCLKDLYINQFCLNHAKNHRF